MAERGKRPPSLVAGACLMALLGLSAVGAPWWATERPWLMRTGEGYEAPAFTGGGDSGRTLLRSPVPYSPRALDLQATLEAPSRRHWMGTDALGRDLAARVIHGARVSLSVGLMAAGFALLLGLPLGAWAGYRGGWADAVVSRLIEAILCVPTLLLVLALVAVAPHWYRAIDDVLRIALVLGVTGWVPVARYLRAEFLKLERSTMVAAARAAGGGHWRVVARHILPSALAPVLVTTAFAVGAAITLEAVLSFLGLGVRPPVATWGGLLADAQEHVDRAWWLALFPGLAIFLAVLGCNLLAEGLRDRLDPRVDRR